MDDEFDDPHAYESAPLGALIWLVLPYSAGRLADANISTTAGQWAGPSVVVIMLAWAAYRPASSPLKMALLRAIDMVFTFGFVVSILGFIVAVVASDLRLGAMHRIAWLLPMIAVGSVAAKLGIRRWVRYALRRSS